MSGRKTREQSNFSESSEFIEQKSKLFHSKVVYALHREHEHYFNKSEVVNSAIDPRCMVCGILLSEFRTTKRFEKLNAPIVLNEDRNAG